MDGNRLIKSMKAIAENSRPGDSLVHGEIISVEPLRIKIDNRFIIDKTFILLSGLCKEKNITFNVQGAPITITIWQGLQIGDRVRILRQNAGQTYYVIEKEGGIS